MAGKCQIHREGVPEISCPPNPDFTRFCEHKSVCDPGFNDQLDTSQEHCEGGIEQEIKSSKDTKDPCMTRSRICLINAERGAI